LRRSPFVVVFALMLLGAGCASSAESPSDRPATEESTPTPSPTRSPRPTPRPTPTPNPRQEIVLLEQGFTPGSTGDGTDWAQVGLVFDNPNPDTHVARFVSIQLTFFDANNALAGSGEETIGPILPGQRGALGTSIFDVRNATEMEVQFRVDWEEVHVDVGSFGFEQVSTRPEQFGGWSTQGFITSTFDQEQENVQVVAIYKDAAGNVLGGDFTFVDFVPAGGRSPFEVSTFSQFDVAVATTDMYAAI
jgi:hypothetical protein